jgi:hypothetical protein
MSNVDEVFAAYKKQHAKWVKWEEKRCDEGAAATLSAIGRAPYTEQILFFMNAFYFDLYPQSGSHATSATGEELGNVIYTLYAKEWAKLDQDQWNERKDVTPDNYMPTDSIDQSYAQMFVEKIYKAEGRPPVTAVQMKKELAAIDINSDGRLSMIEFLLWHLNKKHEDMLNKFQLNNADLYNAYQAKHAWRAEKDAWLAKEKQLQQTADEATGVKKGKAAQVLKDHQSTSENLNASETQATKLVTAAKKNALANAGNPFGPYTALGVKWWLARKRTEDILRQSQKSQKKA